MYTDTDKCQVEFSLSKGVGDCIDYDLSVVSKGLVVLDNKSYRSRTDWCSLSKTLFLPSVVTIIEMADRIATHVHRADFQVPGV